MRIGVDLGGTKLEAIGLDAAGHELARMRVPTPHEYAGTLRAIAELVAAVESRTGRRGSVGLAIPGTPAPETGLVKNANSTWLNGRPLGRDLSETLARPVRLRNDADCFALSEATDGAGAGARTVFGVILGTGVGGGLVIDGTGVSGPNRITGEWGHNPLPWPDADEVPGPACYCGKRGCIETFLSGPGFQRAYEARSGREETTRGIVRRAVRGEAAADAALERYRHRLARGLATVINVLDPDVVVLGGGMSNLPGLAEAATELLPGWIFSDSLRTKVVPNRHGDSSGVRGAAWLWPPDPRA